MRYRYLDDFRRGISVFAIFSFGIAVLGTPQCPPPRELFNPLLPICNHFYKTHKLWTLNHIVFK